MPLNEHITTVDDDDEYEYDYDRGNSYVKALSLRYKAELIRKNICLFFEKI